MGARLPRRLGVWSRYDRDRVPRTLPEGLYEALVSLGLREAIRATPLTSKFGDPDEGDSADWFARHVAVAALTRQIYLWDIASVLPILNASTLPELCK